MDVRLFGVFSQVEWMLSREHLVDDDPESPDIDSLSVPLACSLLRGHIQDRTHDFVDVVTGSEHVGVDFRREPEVCDLRGVGIRVQLVKA